MYDIVNKGSLCPLPRNNRDNRDSRPDRAQAHQKLEQGRAGQGRVQFPGTSTASTVIDKLQSLEIINDFGLGIHVPRTFIFLPPPSSRSFTSDIQHQRSFLLTQRPL